MINNNQDRDDADRARKAEPRETPPYKVIAPESVPRKEAEPQWWRMALNASPDPIFLVDHASLRLVDANRSACDRLGYSWDHLLTSGLADIFPYLKMSDLGPTEGKPVHMPAPSVVLPTVMCHKDGTELPVELSVRRLDSAASPHLVCFARMADERTGGVLSIFQDSLTGLPDRRLFDERLRQALEHGRRTGEYRLAVLFVDLDRFKGVNDTLGHAAGDHLLCEVGRRLLSCVRGVDLVSRYGGDEFMVLLNDVSSECDAVTIAERIHHALDVPFAIRDGLRSVRASIGVALASPELNRADELFDAADAAMYRVKAAGGSGYGLGDDWPEAFWKRKAT